MQVIGVDATDAHLAPLAEQLDQVPGKAHRRNASENRRRYENRQEDEDAQDDSRDRADDNHAFSDGGGILVRIELLSGLMLDSTWRKAGGADAPFGAQALNTSRAEPGGAQRMVQMLSRPHQLVLPDGGVEQADEREQAHNRDGSREVEALAQRWVGACRPPVDLPDLAVPQLCLDCVALAGRREVQECDVVGGKASQREVQGGAVLMRVDASDHGLELESAARGVGRSG